MQEEIREMILKNLENENKSKKYRNLCLIFYKLQTIKEIDDEIERLLKVFSRKERQMIKEQISGCHAKTVKSLDSIITGGQDVF